MKNKKESIVVFEDWFRYARCLNDAEFREFMSAILNYYKTQEQPKFTGLMLDVWNDIVDDLETNVSKKQAKRDTMLRNAKTNPKLNIVPNIGPDIESNIESKITPNTSGMVDGRLEMEDDEMIDDGLETDDDKIVNEIRKGTSFEILRTMFPHSSSLVDLYFDHS
jgi:hypothetical protein